jgi:hypothetical protein
MKLVVKEQLTLLKLPSMQLKQMLLQVKINLKLLLPSQMLKSHKILLKKNKQKTMTIQLRNQLMMSIN